MHEQTMIKQGEKLEKSRIIIRDFNFPFLVTNRRGREAGRKSIKTL